MGKIVLHIVDMATQLCSAAFIRSQNTSEIWRTIQQLWMLLDFGTPDHILVDQGSS